MKLMVAANIVSGQMEIQLQEGSTTNHIQSDCNKKKIEISNRATNSIDEVKKEEVLKLIQLMNVSMICIYQEICKQKENEDEINKKLMWCSCGEKHIESKKQAIRSLEQYYLAKVMKPGLPMRSIFPRTAGCLPLTQKDAGTPVVVGTDRKRCLNRLKKEGTGFEYLEQVQEELLSLKKSGGRTIGGMQELNDVMESLVHRTQHGNNNQTKEKRIFHEIQKLEETKEKYKYIEPKELSPHDYWNGKVVRARKVVEALPPWAGRNKTIKHKIKIHLNDIKEVKMVRMPHTARAILLKAELEQVRKSIRCMEREVEKITSMRMKAYKCAYELQEQMEVRYSFIMYESTMTNVERLVREGDVVALRRVCDNEFERFMWQWSSGKVFPDHYEWAYRNVDSNKKIGEQMKEKSSGNDHQSLIIYVKKLVHGGDVVALRQICSKKVDEFLRQWSNSEMFLDD